MKTAVIKTLVLFVLIFASLKESNAQWVSQTSGTTQYLTGVYFADANTGYATGGQQTFLKTTDGGATWQSINVNLFSGEEYSALFFVNANTGWFSTGSGEYNERPCTERCE